MERVLRRQDSSATSVSPRELDGRLYSFASGRGEERLVQPPTGSSAKPICQFTREVRHMCLDHRRTTPRQLFLQSLHNVGMIVANVVNAVSRKEVHDSAAICREKLGSHTGFVTDVHLQQVEKPHPLRIYVFCVNLRITDLSGLNCGSHCSPRNLRRDDNRGRRRRNRICGNGCQASTTAAK